MIRNKYLDEQKEYIIKLYLEGNKTYKEIAELWEQEQLLIGIGVCGWHR